LKRGLSSNVGVSRPKKSVRRVMTQINPAQLPDKLIDVEVTTQMPLTGGCPKEWEALLSELTKAESKLNS
jgi:hypothetical protein